MPSKDPDNWTESEMRRWLQSVCIAFGLRHSEPVDARKDSH